MSRGNPDELGAEVAEMQRDFSLHLVGCCCGTDLEHTAAIARATAD